MMTKDLAQLVGPRQKWLTTDEFLDHVAERLGQIASAPEPNPHRVNREL